MKQFNIPSYYRSSIIGILKEIRKNKDPRKKDFLPSVLDFGPVRFFIARHFGFCYGVENAIEISYKALEENPDKRVFLLSQMIHNADVNADLQSRGVKFIMDTDGRQFIPWNELKSNDVLIIPAFGTTLEIEKIIAEIGIEVHKYNTTCPFVERVWKKSEKLGNEKFTIIIHGKNNHEETRATFSHSAAEGPSLILEDIEETKFLGEYLIGNHSKTEFENKFQGRYSKGFDPILHLSRIGVVNQTTMLASETQEIAEYLRQVMIKKFGEDQLSKHFADTRDTLCYATNDNQSATMGLLEQDVDLAIVVGGYNSSNTSHLVELCERQLPTFFISSQKEIKSKDEITHFDFHSKKMMHTHSFLPKDKNTINIALTSGASCPDAIVDGVIDRILSFFDNATPIEKVFEKWASENKA